MKNLFDTVNEIGPQLAANITEEEAQRAPSNQTLNILQEHGLTKLFLPKSLGGLESDPLTTARLVESVASFNTGAAWSMMVSNVTFWSGGLLPEAGVEAILADPDVRLAGAFHPPMHATPLGDGYLLNGRSPLTSNVSTATWVFVTALVMDGDHPRIIDGAPEVIAAYLFQRDCQILDTWYTNGMRATDSNDIVAENVFVPAYLAHPLRPGLPRNKYYTGPLYNFPIIGASINCLISPVALATARNTISEFKIMAARKIPFGSMLAIRDRGAVQRKLGMAEAMVQSSQAYLYKTLTDSWQKTMLGTPMNMEDRAALLLAATHTNQSCCQAVDLLYSAAGSSAIYLKSKIGYHFTNAQVIRQHGFSNESRYETAAQVYFGLTPDMPALAM